MRAFRLNSILGTVLASFCIVLFQNCGPFQSGVTGQSGSNSLSSNTPGSGSQSGAESLAFIIYDPAGVIIASGQNMYVGTEYLVKSIPSNFSPSQIAWKVLPGSSSACTFTPLSVDGSQQQMVCSSVGSLSVGLNAMDANGQLLSANSGFAVNPTLPGVALYTNNCASCHGPIATSSKLGVSAAQITAAINGNVGGMGFLKNLTQTEITEISAALQ